MASKAQLANQKRFAALAKARAAKKGGGGAAVASRPKNKAKKLGK